MIITVSRLLPNPSWQIKLWRIDRLLPNLPKFISAKVFYHMLRTYVLTYVSTYNYVLLFIILDFYLSALSLKEDKNVKMFIKSLSLHLISSSHHGHVDIFAPLTTSGTYVHLYIRTYVCQCMCINMYVCNS